jgi:hypothetical protein
MKGMMNHSERERERGRERDRENVRIRNIVLAIKQFGKKRKKDNNHYSDHY